MTPLRSLRVLALAASVAATAALPLPASAQSDLRTLNDRLDRIERDVANLYAGRGGSPSSGGGAGGSYDVGTLNRLDMIEAQMRELTGQVERALYSTDQLNKRLERLQQDVEYRLNALEKSGAAAPAGGDAGKPGGGEGTTVISSVGAGTRPPGGAPGTPPSSTPPSSTPATLPSGTAAQQYDNAMQLLRQARYEEAGAAFKAFMQQHPDHPFMENVQYWYGETFYVRQKYTDAAKIFLENYEKYPKGGKAPDNLLKLGMSLAALDKSKEACVALAKLREYPQAPTTITSRADAERRRLQCR